MRLDHLQLSVEAVLRAFGRSEGTVALELYGVMAMSDIRALGVTESEFFQAMDLADHLGLTYTSDGMWISLTPRGLAASRDAVLGRWSLDRHDPQLAVWVELEELRAATGQTLREGDATFSRLSLTDWRQFGEVDLSFHPRMTIITGANAAGKTTLLNVLAPHFQWNSQLLGSDGISDVIHEPVSRQVGRLVYSNGERTPVTQQSHPASLEISLMLPRQQAVPGIFGSSYLSVGS